MRIRPPLIGAGEGKPTTWARPAPNLAAAGSKVGDRGAPPSSPAFNRINCQRSQLHRTNPVRATRSRRGETAGDAPCDRPRAGRVGVQAAGLSTGGVGGTVGE